MNDRTKDYVFLSYSHQNDIQDLVKAFDEHGYNIVFDESLSYGEQWDLSIRRYIKSEKCKGVMLLVSDKSLISKPILSEIEYTNMFRKKMFCIMNDNLTIAELCKTISNRLNEDEEYVMENISEYLSDEKIFVPRSSLDWNRIDETFKTWGFKKELNELERIDFGSYTSDLKGEKERLFKQQTGYYHFDMEAINQVLDTFTRDNLCVMDLGCSNGQLTISRFASDPRIKKVIGIDYNQKDVDAANESAKEYGDKFSFYKLDLESKTILEELEAILSEQGIEKVDIVFSALTLHHLKQPKVLLMKIYDLFSEDGKIILRGSDDGGKLCYPGSELLQEIITRYEKLVPSSDRSNGRKLYSRLYDSGYLGIKMMYQVTDTCEKDRKKKENIFNVGFSFRLNRIDELIRLNPDNEHLKQERAWFEEALSKFKEIFCDRKFWYCNVSYIAIAGVKE